MDAAVRTRGEWTDEDDARLRQLIEEHLSYAQIGEIVGRSKGSCIGRAHRLGIHNSKTKPMPKKKVAEAVSRAVSSLFPPRPVNTQDNAPVPLYPQPEASTTPLGKPRTLMQLQPHHCRWPVSGERAETLFCGAVRETMTRPYCAEHHLVAWRPSPDRRDLSRLAKVYR